jgi:hypothetical protein
MKADMVTVLGVGAAVVGAYMMGKSRKPVSKCTRSVGIHPTPTDLLEFSVM